MGDREARERNLGAFEVGRWQAEPGLNLLRDAAEERPVEPRAMDVLVCLARHAGETVSKETLLAEVWGGAFVVEGVVAKTVFALRQALGDDADEPRFILTVPRRGYRLIAPVRTTAVSADADLASEPVPVPARAGGRRALAALALLLVVGGAGAVGLLRARRATPEPAGPARFERLAVAPFEALGSPAESEALAAALRAELVAELVRFPRPRVHLLEASQVAGSGALVLARAIGSDGMLRGSVAVLPGRVRVDLQLIDAGTEEVRWTTSVERPPNELYALGRRLAAAVAERVEAAGAERRLLPVEGRPPIPPETYRSFLEARFLWSRRGIEDLQRARELFRRITDEAPAFAAGFAWLALAEVTNVNYRGGDARAGLSRAEAAAGRALELDAEEPVAHVAAGLVSMNLRMAPEEAVASYRRATELAPSFAPAHQLLAEACSAAERHEEAVAAAGEAVALEPFSPVMHGVRGLVLHAAGRPGEALEALDRALVLAPRFAWLHRYRAYALAHLGRPDDAAREFLEEARGVGESAESLAALERAIASQGLTGYWRWRLDRLTALEQRGIVLRPTQKAEALAALGRGEEALAALARAPAALDGEYFVHYRTSPAFDELRKDVRFRALYARGGG